MNADRRVSALRRRLVEDEMPALLVTNVSNVRYLTGFEGVFDDEANVALLLTREAARVYTDSRYSEAVEEAAEGTPWVLRVPRESLYIELCEELRSVGLELLALEASVPFGRFRFVSEQFGGAVQIVDQWVEGLRQVKEAAEVERIVAAAALTDRAFHHIVDYIKPGMRECDVGLELEIFMRRNGSEGIAFAPIVASGPNSSRPHATVSDRTLEDGDLVTLDFGARVQGYCADMTRTVVIGTASDRQRAVYEAVAAANEEAVARAKAGLPGAEIDGFARAALGRHDLAEYFGHGLGHGVGLEVHELPNISPRGRESVPAGAVVTIEPGVYISGFGGVRIEDLVLVEDAGVRVLSNARRDLIEIGP